MKKDINIPQVKDIYITAVRDSENTETDNWSINFINDKDVTLDTVMITSKGYEINDGKKKVVSSTIRHQLKNVKANSVTKVEMIISEVFSIHNEYWVTFFESGQLMERKLTFAPHTIDKKSEVQLTGMDARGVLAE